VSSIQAGTMLNPNGPTTNKRSIESTVVVDDGNLVVLGGLLQDEYSGNEQKIPMLGDVPGVGALFRTDTRERKKTNLMVFLRPVVVRSNTDVDALSMDRYDLMRSVQQVAQPAESVTVPINQAPAMGALPKAAGTRPVPAPLMTPGLSDTWGGGPGGRPAPAASPAAPAAATQP
jgi:general secretion pathway protein D